MSNSYTIKKTDGSVAVTILAGTANGDIGTATGHDSDLLLYGRGTFNWGAGIEQNLIRLTENWSYPSANSSAAINSQYPKVSTATNEGIKKPFIGQTWFNSSNKKLYVNTGGGLGAGNWTVDHVTYDYLQLPKTTDQEMKGKLRITSTNHQPDLYIHSTRQGFGAGTGTGGADQGASSFITFESTDADGDRVRGAYIANQHVQNMLRIALGDREYQTLNTSTGLMEKNTYTGNAILNYIQLEDEQTLTSKNIWKIGDAQERAYWNGDHATSLYSRALTTAEWVKDYVFDVAEANVYTYGDPRYLKLSDTTARIQTDGDARYVQLTGDTMTGPLDVFYTDPRIVLAAPFGGGGYDHNVSLRFKYGSQFLAEMYMLTGGDVTTSMIGTFDQSAYTTDSKLIIQKNDGGAIPVNGIVIYDDEIRTHHTRGKIHTPLTVSGDADDTVTTKKYVDDKVDAVDLSDYYIKNDALSITRDTGDINPAIYVRAEDIADITIETTGTSTDSLGRLSFKTNGGYRGYIGMQTMAPTATEDTLIIRKQHSTLTNEIQLQDGITQFKKRLTVIPNDGLVAPGLDFVSTKNNAAYNNWVNGYSYDHDNPNGIVWKNSQGALRGAIQHNNTNQLKIMVTPVGGTTGNLNQDNTYIEVGESLIKVNKNIFLEADARPLNTDVFPDNYNLATNHGVVTRTYRQHLRSTTPSGFHYVTGGNGTWQSDQGSNINQTHTRPDATNNTVVEFPTTVISIAAMTSEALAQKSIKLDINVPMWISCDSDSPSMRAVPIVMEWRVINSNASVSSWTNVTVGQVIVWENGSSQVNLSGSVLIEIPDPDLALTLNIRFKHDDFGLWSRVNGPYNSTYVGVGTIDSYWV